MKRKNYEKGITLIALVITIIILLILAGVTISIVFNDGIAKNAQTAVDKYSEESAKEKLSLTLFDYKTDKIMKKDGVNLQTTLSKLGPVIDAGDTNYYEVEIDGYLFWVHKESLEIISKGPSNPVPPTKIEFSSTTDEAYIGEGKTFSLKLEPNNANSKFLTWSVNDESIATISNGVLTGLKEGTVTVTVTSTEDSSIKSTCSVTIKAIELTGISLNKTSTTIALTKTEKLEVTYTPANATYKDVIWNSSDETIATVEQDGTVTGVKAGTSKITVISTKNSSVKAECNVTVEEIIEISTVEQLKTFRDAVNSGTLYAGKKVVLTNDLDLSSICYRVDGTEENDKSWEAIGTKTNYFSGTFDGQGHTICNLYINKPNQEYQGLFGNINSGVPNGTGTIKNLILENINVTGKNYVGGIVGNASHATIEKCMTSGNIVSNSYSGGIVGVMSGDIKNCYNKAKVSSEKYSAGGMIGISSGKLSIINCYNVGEISGNNYAGGIVGFYDSTSKSLIKNCYNKGIICSNSTSSWYSAGGIVGYLRKSIQISNCYNEGNITGTSNVKGEIIGYIERDSSNEIEITNCSYLTGKEIEGIGYTADSSLTVESSDTLPSVLSVINEDNEFAEDTNNINEGYPIFNWRK